MRRRLFWTIAGVAAARQRFVDQPLMRLHPWHMSITEKRNPVRSQVGGQVHVEASRRVGAVREELQGRIADVGAHVQGPVLQFRHAGDIDGCLRARRVLIAT